MQSKSTLVDPRSSDITLEFAKDSVHNTSITALCMGKSMRYEVISDPRAATTHLTKSVGGGAPIEVGAIQRHAFAPDTVQIGDVKVRINKWLKTPLLDFLYVLNRYVARLSNIYHNSPATLSVEERKFVWQRSGFHQLVVSVNS